MGLSLVVKELCIVRSGEFRRLISGHVQLCARAYRLVDMSAILTMCLRVWAYAMSCIIGETHAYVCQFQCTIVSKYWSQA